MTRDGRGASAHDDEQVWALAPLLDLGDCSGVTQIRVHGVGGATPDAMLGTPDVRQVAGGRIAGSYRSPDVAPGRHTEAYSWGGLTSRSRVRALWVFLLPFTMANLAGWTSPPRTLSEKGTAKPDHSKGPVHELRLAAARWAGLAMTLSVIVTLALLTMDVVAYQCGAKAECRGSSAALTPLTWGDLPDNPAHRLVAGSSVLVAALAVLAAVLRKSRERYEAIEPPFVLITQDHHAPGAGASAPYLVGGLTHRDFWNGSRCHTRLTRVHLAAAVGAITVVLAVCTTRLDELGPAPGGVALPAIGVGLAVAAVLGAVVVLGSDRIPGLNPLALWPASLALVLSLVGYGCAVVAALAHNPTGFPEGQAPGVVDAFNGVWVAIGLLMLPLAVGSFHRRPRRDPDSIGWIPPFAAFGMGMICAHVILLPLVIFTAAALAGPGEVAYVDDRGTVVAQAGSARDIVLPVMVARANAYLVWGILALGVFTVVLFAVRWKWLAGRGTALRAFLDNAHGSAHDYDTELGTSAHTVDQIGTPDAWYASAAAAGPLAVDPGQPAPATTWTRNRARSEFAARSSVYVSRLINTMVGFAVGLVVLVWLFVWVGHVQPPSVGVAGAVAIALLLPPALLSFVVLSWRSLERRRVIGALWDVSTFWPRAFHPFAPPSYAERAVPELTRRVWWINDNGGEVVILAHSQGSILAAATALRHELEIENKPRFTLLTYGSPLRKLYGHAFPAYWSAETIAAIREPKTSLVVNRDWTNVHYLTDYIGGPVGVEGVDLRLPDPVSSLHVYGQPEPKVLSHTGYTNDPRFWAIVDRLVERVAAARRGDVPEPASPR